VEDAVSCYGKGLEADDLAEEIYRRLMVCHLRQGQEAKALSVYKRCRNTLSSVLGCILPPRRRPSPPRSVAPRPDSVPGVPTAGEIKSINISISYAPSLPSVQFFCIRDQSVTKAELMSKLKGGPYWDL